ncbi:MAG: hypothetical protein LKE40_05730 [Spirochaetia bacterium]|nr:hypothetical protein [Spirochaetia bacterium]
MNKTQSVTEASSDTDSRDDIKNDGAVKGQFPNEGMEPSIAVTATNDTPSQPQLER